MKAMLDLLSRRSRDYTVIGGNQDKQRARDRRPFRNRLAAVFTRHVATFYRAAISFVVRECRPAGD